MASPSAKIFEKKAPLLAIYAKQIESLQQIGCAKSHLASRPLVRLWLDLPSMSVVLATAVNQLL